MSNCVFNFNILTLVVSEILGVPNLRYGALCPPLRPLAEFVFVPEASTLLCLMAFFNFNFLALLLSEIFGGAQIYTRGPYAPWTPPSGKIFVPKASTSQYLIAFLISTFEL